MKMIKFDSCLLLLLLLAGQALAYDDKQQMIDDKLNILASGSEPAKIEMLERLQWSGLSDPRLFDKIAEWPASSYGDGGLSTAEVTLMSYQIRALGYSGNNKYLDLLNNIEASAGNNKLKRHARSAIKDMGNYQRWNAEIAQSDFSVAGKSYEIASYMKMIDSSDTAVQRMGARAVYHERRQDAELLAMMADKLKASYKMSGLDAQTQDTLAWFCRALGLNGRGEYIDLLVEVRDNTPYGKIKKWAKKSVR
jgi:hypothetical protein